MAMTAVSAPLSSKTDLQALAKCITCLLNSVTTEGVWGDFQREWDAVITAITCDLLLTCGLTPDTPWFVQREGYTHYTLARSFAWLNNAIQPDGRFGSDYWDAARLGIAIERHKLYSYFPSYPYLSGYLRSECDSDRLDSSSAHWAGPGFHAIAAEYMLCVGDRARAIGIFDRLVKLQDANAEWAGQTAISPVWHSS